MTKIVGILNITPDSFFDGGKYHQQENALKQLEILLQDGADVIDIGAESTRPDATAIDTQEEIKRLKDILPQIISEVQKHNQKNHQKVEISLDSRHSKTIAWALGLGIDVINDVSGFVDFAMVELAAQSGKKIIVMHNLGIPADKNKIIDESLDVVEVLIDWMKSKLEILLKAGVKKSQIIFDVGIGFGKNAFQSIKILQEIDRFRVLDLPLYIGHSNKSFLDEIKSSDLLESGNSSLLFRRESGCTSNSECRAREVHKITREEKTIAVSNYLIDRGVEYLRLHKF